METEQNANQVLTALEKWQKKEVKIKQRKPKNQVNLNLIVFYQT